MRVTEAGLFSAVPWPLLSVVSDACCTVDSDVLPVSTSVDGFIFFGAEAVCLFTPGLFLGVGDT